MSVYYGIVLQNLFHLLKWSVALKRLEITALANTKSAYSSSSMKKIPFLFRVSVLLVFYTIQFVMAIGKKILYFNTA